MKFLSSLVFIILFCGQVFGQAANPVEIKLTSSSSIQAGHTTITFQLFDSTKNKPISDADLNIEMEKKLHMIIYDAALKEFQHVHPEFTTPPNGSWQVEADFQVNGHYWIWAQGQLASSNTDFSVSTNIDINGGAAAWPAPAILTDIRSNDDAGSVVTLSKTVLKAGKEVMLNMTFSRTDNW